MSRSIMVMGVSAYLVTLLLLSVASPSLAYAVSSGVEYVPPPDVLPVVFLSGTPYEMGYQYGLQTGAYMEITKNSLWSQLLAGYTKEEIKHYLEGFRYYVNAQLNDLIIGMADGAKDAGYDVTYSDVLLMFCQAELAFAPPPETAKYGFGCTCISAFGNATKDGKALAGANFDFFWNPFAYRVIVVAFPSTGNSFIASANAGNLANNFVLNSKGLVLMNNRGCDKRPIDKAYGLPTWLQVPYIAMSASSAEEAKNLLVKTPLTMGVYHHFVDENGTAYAVETTAASAAVRKPGDFGERSYLVTTNHWIMQDMKDSAWAWPPTSKLGSTWYRYQTAVRYLETYYGRLDVDKFKEILGSRDYWDGSGWHKDAAWTGNTINRYGVWGGTVTSHIGIPADRVVYICAGNPGGDWGTGAPGLTGEYVRLKLGDNPAAVTDDASQTAISYLKMANEAISNLKDVSLSDKEILTKKFDSAKDAYFKGIAYQAKAALEEDRSQSLKLYGEASTYFCKAQAYALQVVSLAKTSTHSTLTQTSSILPYSTVILAAVVAAFLLKWKRTATALQP